MSSKKRSTEQTESTWYSPLIVLPKLFGKTKVTFRLAKSVFGCQICSQKQIWQAKNRLGKTKINFRLVLIIPNCCSYQNRHLAEYCKDNFKILQDQCAQQEAWIKKSCKVVKELKRKVRELTEAAKAPSKPFVPSKMPKDPSLSDSEVQSYSSMHTKKRITIHINLLLASHHTHTYTHTHTHTHTHYDTISGDV
jgi:hypothetical protein